MSSAAKYSTTIAANCTCSRYRGVQNIIPSFHPVELLELVAYKQVLLVLEN